MYRGSNRVAKDYTKAMEYYFKSANQGNSLAKYAVGIHSFHSNMFTQLIIDLNRVDVS